MIGIYKITNKINGKSYIGQSNNINRRFYEHSYKGEAGHTPIDRAIKEYGKENFDFEVLEECSLNELNERETYWIKYYNTVLDGYNCNFGGMTIQQGEHNSHVKITENDVILARKAYSQHKRQKDIYNEYFKNKITFKSFQYMWQGKSWPNVMPEVFTQENKDYYIYQNSKGSKGVDAALTDAEVMAARKRYVNESAKQIYKDYQNKMQFQTFQAMLWGRSYKNLPIYRKKEKKWINEEPVSTIS